LELKSVRSSLVIWSHTRVISLRFKESRANITKLEKHEK
jgi:hypothetical protein